MSILVEVTAQGAMAPPAAGENRFFLPGVGWQGYETLLKLIGNRAIRVTYSQGDVELMSPLLEHERNRSIFAQMIVILTDELEIPRLSAGATTLKREDLDRGLEADEAFYFRDLRRIKSVQDFSLESDPPPDLAVEIEITRSALNRLGIYGTLGVPEIWRYDGRTLRFLARQSDGSYAEILNSKALPWISAEELRGQLPAGEQLDETAWARGFRRWVRETVVPRASGHAEGI